MKKGLRHIGLVLVTVTLLTASSGCELDNHWHLPEVMHVSWLSFGAGWLLGQNNVAETRECFLNRDPIACTDAFN